MLKIIIGIIAVAIIGFIGFMIIDPQINNGTVNSYIIASEDLFRCTIEGEVKSEKTYVLSEGATMGDLIDAAGGLTDNADTLAFFEDAQLTNGMTYFIASKYDDSDICNDTEIQKVNVNADDALTLQNINGISSAVANSIVSHRAENGMFYTIEQLMDVYGIGNATYNKIRNYVTLHT